LPAAATCPDGPGFRHKERIAATVSALPPPPVMLLLSILSMQIGVSAAILLISIAALGVTLFDRKK
jgi:hypothetical protein